jgi:curved DNA-binding protein CbpA
MTMPKGTDPPDSQRAPLSWKTRDRYPTSRPRAEPTAEEAAKLSELHATLDALGKQDDFAVLGIAPGSSSKVAAAAFFEMARLYHPDLFARYDDPAIRQTATEIFVLLQHASTKIRDRELRRAKGADAAAAARSIEGERNSQPDDARRSGAPEMTTGERFVEALTHAAHHRNREAELLLLIALADQPSNTAGKRCLLTVQARQAKAAGKLDEAARRYEEVLALDPHNVEASHELRSLPGAFRRAKAFVGRLWQRGGSSG